MVNPVGSLQTVAVLLATESSLYLTRVPHPQPSTLLNLQAVFFYIHLAILSFFLPPNIVALKSYHIITKQELLHSLLK